MALPCGRFLLHRGPSQLEHFNSLSALLVSGPVLSEGCPFALCKFTQGLLHTPDAMERGGGKKGEFKSLS